MWHSAVCANIKTYPFLVLKIKLLLTTQNQRLISNVMWKGKIRKLSNKTRESQSLTFCRNDLLVSSSLWKVRVWSFALDRYMWFIEWMIFSVFRKRTLVMSMAGSRYMGMCSGQPLTLCSSQPSLALGITSLLSLDVSSLLPFWENFTLSKKLNIKKHICLFCLYLCISDLFLYFKEDIILFVLYNFVYLDIQQGWLGLIGPEKVNYEEFRLKI